MPRQQRSPWSRGRRASVAITANRSLSGAECGGRRGGLPRGRPRRPMAPATLRTLCRDVVDIVRQAVANQVGGLLWPSRRGRRSPPGPLAEGDGEPSTAGWLCLLQQTATPGPPCKGWPGVFAVHSGGGCGIRTREGVNPTRFPSVRHRPLGESSAFEHSRVDGVPPRPHYTRPRTPRGVHPVNSPRAGRQQGSTGSGGCAGSAHVRTGPRRGSSRTVGPPRHTARHEPTQPGEAGRQAEGPAPRRGRARAAPSSGPTPIRSPRQDAARGRAAAAARCPCGRRRPARRRAAGRLRRAGRELDLAADAVLGVAVRAAWESGWQPADLASWPGVSWTRPAAGVLLEAIVIESRRYARGDRASALAAGRRLGRGRARVRGRRRAGQLRAWAGRHGSVPAAALVVLLRVLAALRRAAGRSNGCCRCPGAPAARRRRPEGEVDHKVLAKVRALLAKAESTEFPEEAEALSAKAQELMSRYSLHRAVLDHDRGRAPTASGRRLWMDAPYPGAKVLLVQAVAAANRCRTVWRERPGLRHGGRAGHRAGHRRAAQHLAAAAGQPGHAGRRAAGHPRRHLAHPLVPAVLPGRLRVRIGERLAAADTSATTRRGAADEKLLPVLAARSRAADEMIDRLFPGMVSRRCRCPTPRGGRPGGPPPSSPGSTCTAPSPGSATGPPFRRCRWVASLAWRWLCTASTARRSSPRSSGRSTSPSR